MLLLLAVSAFAKVDVRINPNKPVKDEEFTVDFVISGIKNGVPEISFTPMGVEVLERNVTSQSTRTTYTNGRLVVEKIITITYKMIANSVGTKYLTSLKITDGDITISEPSVRIQVLSEPEAPKYVFAMAVPSKTEVFAGESIVVRYYIYNSLPLQDFKINKYAKLDKFLKRFHQEQTGLERVNYNGALYTRRIVYSAQLYANKAGIYKLDPMEFGVTYSQGRSIDPFNSIFGGGGRSITKNISSPSVEITVKQLPIENVPNNFTGLVGKHTFKLDLNRSKFLTNEPIELKFSVTGPGALELYESPSIVKHQDLEEFVSDSDLGIKADFTATKTFSMTYLGRAALTIPAKPLSFSYFDPDSQQYISEEVKFPGIEVVASQARTRESETPKDEDSVPIGKNEMPDVVNRPSAQPAVDYFKPVYYFENIYLNSAKYINLALFILLLLGLSYKGFEFISYRSMQRHYGDLELLKTKGVDYKNLYNAIKLLGNGTDMKDILDKSVLSPEAKDYFKNLVNLCEKEYLEKGFVKSKKIKLKYLKEIIKVVS